MTTGGLLPVERVAPFDATSLRLLDRVGACARELLATCLALPPYAQGFLLECRAFLYRRWVLETLLLVRFRGPMGYGGISRALGGVPSGSLSPKLKELKAAGLLSRRETGDDVGSVLYETSQGGTPVADAVYALTASHAYQHAAVHAGKPAPEVGDFTALPSPDPGSSFEATRRAYAEATRAFAEYDIARQTAPGFESTLETATRFTEACDRKWQGAIQVALFAGPQSFGSLTRGLDLGDQALALALRDLQTLGAIRRGEDNTYTLAPFGIYNTMFGVGALTLLRELHRSNPSAYHP